MQQKTIWLENITRSHHQLSMTYGVDNIRFETSYWYSSVDFFDLEKKYSSIFMEKLYFHIMMFEVNKLASLHPSTIDLGPFASFHTREFETLWYQILHKIWAQWRYENNRPYYKGPMLLSTPRDECPKPIQIEPGEIETLSFCGGGKDSLVAMKLLDEAQISYASLAYSNPIYGMAKPQHDLIDNLLDHGKPHQRHRLYTYDSFIDSPILQFCPEYDAKEIIAAETPSSIFAALPIALQHGYTQLVLGHERSANIGNLIWDITGEDVNHQWGKSFEAELLLNAYLQSEFITNCTYFSILQPIYDVVIFNLLKKSSEGIPNTHSCNIRKPWCCRCPKCAYVWLSYMAYLDVEMVNEIFKVNLFDLAENQLSFKQMLGLTDHTPFECIGQIEETRLAFELCRRKGLKGKAMDIYTEAFPTLDVEPIVDRFCTVDETQHGIPPKFASKILPQMQATANAALHLLNDKNKTR